MPFRDGYVSVRHDGGLATELENRTGGTIVWRASFMGGCSSVKVGRRNADEDDDMERSSWQYCNVG